jgi:hypothetical protein
MDGSIRSPSVGQQLQERRPEQERKARLGKKKKKNQPIYNLPYDILLWMPLLFLVSIFFSVINTVADFWCFFLGWGCHFH